MKKLITITATVLALQTDAAQPRVSTSTATTTTTTTQDGSRVVVSMEKDGKIQTRTYVVPSSTPPVVSTRLDEMERVPYLGIALAEPSEDLARHLGLKEGVGVLAAQVLKDSPAAKAGLRSHDLVSKIDDQVLFNVSQAVSLIRSLEAGQEVAVTFYRGGKRKILPVTLDEQEMLKRPLPARLVPGALPVLTNQTRMSAPVSFPAPFLANTNFPPVAFDQTHLDLIRQSYAQAAAIAATNPLLGHRAVLIKKAGGNTLVQEVTEVHAKVRRAVEQSLKGSRVPAAEQKQILTDLDRFLKESIPD